MMHANIKESIQTRKKGEQDFLQLLLNASDDVRQTNIHFSRGASHME